MQMANNTQKHKWAIFRNTRMAPYGGYWEKQAYFIYFPIRRFYST